MLSIFILSTWLFFVCAVEEEAHQETTTEEEKDEAEVPINGGSNCVPAALPRSKAGLSTCSFRMKPFWLVDQADRSALHRFQYFARYNVSI